MKNITKQVVILDNLSSPYIQQAIIILKEYNPSIEQKIIEEAEVIVSKYLSKNNSAPKKEEKKLLPVILGAISIISITSLILTYLI